MAAKEKGAEAPARESIISTAPPPAPSKNDSNIPMTVEVMRDEHSPKALYWAGTLLMEGEFDWETPATLEEVFGGIVSEDDSGEFRKTIKTTAFKLWNPGNGAARIWACRNRYYQQLDVTGLCFPAFTQESEGDATNESVMHVRTYPGHVFPMSDVKLRYVLEQVKNHALRPVGPPWRSFPGAQIVNYMHGHMPGCKGGRLLTDDHCESCRELERALPATANLERPRRNTPIEHRQPGDLPFSDFIYLLKLDAPWDTPRREYINLVRSMHEFIRTQPPALSKDLAKVIEKDKAA